MRLWSRCGKPDETQDVDCDRGSGSETRRYSDDSWALSTAHRRDIGRISPPYRGPKIASTNSAKPRECLAFYSGVLSVALKALIVRAHKGVFRGVRVLECARYL